MPTGPKIDFLPANHPIQRINPDIRVRLAAAQSNIFPRAFPNAHAFVERVVSDLKLTLPLPVSLKDQSASEIADKPFADVVSFYEPLLQAAGVTGTTLALHAANLSQRTQLVRAFEDPDASVAKVTEKVIAIVADFPRTASDIERGRNPGDVLDPYILAATQTLLYRSDFKGAIEATVAHKALMIIEGLMGHLHEDVIGDMRGNIRAPEPRGTNQEILDPFTNPFPGADVVQPPTAAGERLRVHQVKSKTGSAKGGDGKRLGEQLKQLGQYYNAEMFYDAVIGNTLRGHRSMNAVITAAPNVVVLVGAATFRELTRSANGAQLLLRIYQNATKLTLRDNPDAVVAYCETGAEHPDNERFVADCERWFGRPVERLRSERYASTWEVFEKRRYLAGVDGALCTTELKVMPRLAWQMPTDVHVFGYTADKADVNRAERLRKNWFEITIKTPLIERGLDKAACLDLLMRAGIQAPVMYGLGFQNNNCIPCVKATSPNYWALVRQEFPAEFERMAKLARDLDVRLCRIDDERTFIDDIPADWPVTEAITPSCDFMCVLAEQDMAV